LAGVEGRGAVDAKALASAKQNREKALAFLKDAKPATRSDWLALKMLVDRRHGDKTKADGWQKALRERQNADGGWPFVKGGDSHPLVTGEVLYALSVAGVKGDDPAVRRACGFLVRTQRPNGSWESTSRAALGNTGARKVNAINVHWGTGWATIGLLRTLPVVAKGL